MTAPLISFSFITWIYHIQIQENLCDPLTNTYLIISSWMLKCTCGIEMHQMCHCHISYQSTVMDSYEFLQSHGCQSSDGIHSHMALWMWHKSFLMRCEVMSDMLANVSWSALDVVSKGVLGKGTHYFIPHYVEYLSLNCCTVFWLHETLFTKIQLPR